MQRIRERQERNFKVFAIAVYVFSKKDNAKFMRPLLVLRCMK